MYFFLLLRLVFTWVIFLSFLCGPAFTADANHPPKENVLQGSVSQSELIDSLERLGISCVIHEGAKPALVVQDVHMGSSAYYKGVERGDGIRSLVAQSDHFDLTIERSGNVYQIALKLVNPVLDGRASALAGSVQDKGNPSQKLAAATSQLDLSATKNPMLDGGVKTQKLEGQIEDKQKEPEKKLVPYDI